jgi:hypothetical protein
VVGWLLTHHLSLRVNLYLACFNTPWNYRHVFGSLDPVGLPYKEER